MGREARARWWRGSACLNLEDSEASCPSRLERYHLITLHSPCIGASTCSWSCAFAIKQSQVIRRLCAKFGRHVCSSEYVQDYSGSPRRVRHASVHRRSPSTYAFRDRAIQSYHCTGIEGLSWKFAISPPNAQITTPASWTTRDADSLSLLVDVDVRRPSTWQRIWRQDAPQCPQGSTGGPTPPSSQLRSGTAYRDLVRDP
jgi:hypothetical protein